MVVDGIFWTTLSWRNTKDSFGALINERWGCLDIALGDKGASDGEATPFCNFDARFQVFFTLAGAGTWLSFSSSVKFRREDGAASVDVKRSYEDGVRSAKDASSCKGCLHFWHI